MKRYAKQTALALAMALTVSSVAPATASAATRPSYKKKFNAVKKGKTLTYTVKNIKKGTKVKWSIIGTGKKYVSFNKSKAVYKENTKAAKKKTYSSNKVYVRKNTTKVVKAVVRATVTGKNGKKYTVSDKIAIAKKATTPATTTPASAEPTATAAVTTAPATTAPASAEPTATAAVTTAPATTAPASVAPSATAAVTTAPATTAPVATTAPETSAPVATTTPTVAPTETTAPSATPEVATAAAVSASAVNAKTIAVTFNRELTKTEQEGVKVSVTRDKATQAIKAEFKDAKTLYVTRDADVEFQAATYTVALTGTVEASYDVKVEAPVATSLAINSVVLVDGKEASEVKVALLDQYGVEMTLNNNDFTTVATNKTNNNKDVKIEVKDGKFVIDTATTAADFKVDDQIQITLLHKATGLSATATLKVVESTYVSKITLADTYVLPADTTRLTENTKDVKVYYTAVDNYNQAVDLNSLGAYDSQNEYSIVSTDEKVLDPADVTVDTDATTKETYFKIAQFKKVGKVSLVILSNKSGETSKIDLDVLENAGDVYAAEFETTSVNVAAGSKATINVKLTDRYGDTVEAKGKKADVNLVSSDASQVTAEFDDVETSDNYGKVVIDATDAKEDSTIVLTATVNGTPTIITVKVGKAAVPSTIAVKTNTTSLIKGSEAEIKFDVKDQYGNTVSDEAFNNAKYKIAVTTGEKSIVSTSAAVDSPVPGTTVTVKADDSKDTAVTETVKVELKDANDKTVDTKTITFTIEPNTTKNLTYTVNAIPALYKNTADVTTKAAVDAGYAQKVVVTAKKANGAEITLPAGKVLNVVSDNENIIVGKDEDGQWYVAGKDSAETITKDVTGKITVVVETDDATTIVTADVTVSKDAKQYNEVKLYDSNDKDKRKEVSTVTSSAIGVVAINNLVKADQFGVEVAVTSASAVSLSSYNNVVGTASDVKFEDGKLTISGITVKETDKEASFKATLVIGALTKTITVTIPVTK